MNTEIFAVKYIPNLPSTHKKFYENFYKMLAYDPCYLLNNAQLLFFLVYSTKNLQT